MYILHGYTLQIPSISVCTSIFSWLDSVEARVGWPGFWPLPSDFGNISTLFWMNKWCIFCLACHSIYVWNGKKKKSADLAFFLSCWSCSTSNICCSSFFQWLNFFLPLTLCVFSWPFRSLSVLWNAQCLTRLWKKVSRCIFIVPTWWCQVDFNPRSSDDIFADFSGSQSAAWVTIYMEIDTK